MAEFCARFGWCTPERFWELDILEYEALARLIDREATRKERGGR